MTVSKSTTAAAVLALIAVAPLFAQGKDAKAQAPAASAKSSIDGGTPAYIRAETAEERKARLGTAEDPGLDPDPERLWPRFGHNYKIVKFSRQWETYERQPEGWVRPFAQANLAYEIYQRNEKYVWVWMADSAEAVNTKQKTMTLTPEQEKYAAMLRGEFTELAVRESPKTIRFEESGDGLPSSGSWRNSLAVADMNGDGFKDIIAPPERGVGNPFPSIFLGDGKGHWHVWTDVTYPQAIDYGAVVAADFNRDGKMDLAFAIHLAGVRVWLGDGKGHFTDSSKGLPVQSFPTRKIVAADLDRDGSTDILAVSEGATMRGVPSGPRVRAFMNRKKAAEWQEVSAAPAAAALAGDTLTVGNFNGDRYPDFAGGSVFFQSAELVWLSVAKEKWKLAKNDDAIIGLGSSYAGVTSGHFSSKTLDDVIIAYGRQWPDLSGAGVTAPDMKEIGGLDRISFAKDGTPKRTPILRYSSPKRPILGIATGDFDGDGNEDIIYAAWTPKREFVLLLGDGKGGFARAHLEGITAEPQTNYDVTVADVNGDSRPDVIIAYETDKQGSFGVQNGSIHVFLDRGVVTPAANGTKH